MVSVGKESCLVGFDDGDLSVHSNEMVKALAEMGRLTLLQDTRGLVADEWQVNQALATSSIRIKEKYHPVCLLLGDGVSSLCGKPVYSSHHLSLHLVVVVVVLVLVAVVYHVFPFRARRVLRRRDRHNIPDRPPP